MNICGIKLTHDGAVALIKDNKLEFCVEIEKCRNNPRFQEIRDTEIIGEILKNYGYTADDIDYFAIDGWGGVDQDSLAIQPRLEIANGFNKLSAEYKGNEYFLNVGQYEEGKLEDEVLKEWSFNGLKICNKEYGYKSYLHVASHILSTYCTSDFAKDGEDSYILVWDGGMYPRLYYINNKNEIENLGPIFLLIGNIYTIFSQHFGPFKVKGSFAKDNLSVAGKVMAYIAKGKVHEELYPIFDEIYRKHYSYPMGFANIFANEFKKKIMDFNISDEDILCSFHFYIEKLLIEKLEKKVKRFDRNCKNLCIAGGCGLNIKWNSSIRNCGIFKSVYVSPFPNDSGSAIGAACCAMMSKTNQSFIEWNVYSGPQLIENDANKEWIKKKFNIKQLAELLYKSNEPVVILNGNAELGPRALGNRSIVASPILPEMKSILNYVKGREEYRPVSPICLESKSSNIFQPGISDPYMLFDHMVKEEWRNRIPAVIHLDGSARLQTITKKQNPIIGELIEEFEKLSNIPLLCNTSANYNGKGFFPDIKSAAEWNKVNYIWSGNYLYEKKEKNKFVIK